MSASIHRFGGRPPALTSALALLAAVTVAPPLWGQALQISLVPAAPTWRDAIVVHVASDRITACGSQAFGLHQVGITHSGGGQRVDIELVDRCPVAGPASLRHIEVTTTIGPFDPGPWRVRVADPASAVPTELPFTIYRPGGASVQLPALATDSEPGPMRVYFVSHSNGEPFAQLEVDGHVLQVTYGTISFPVGVPLPAVPVASSADFAIPHLPAGDYEVRLTDGVSVDSAPLRIWAHDRCLPSATALCLWQRFRVTATWHTAGGSGAAQALLLDGNDGSGLMSFFDASNAELTVKALDGCAVNHHWWLFLASGSSVEYEVTVEDTVTGERHAYGSSLGALPPLVTDVAAFGGC